jgi:Ca2+-transporting ATPase
VREATTVAFLTLALAQLWHVLDLRDPRAGPFSNDVTRNPWVWAALALCLALIAAALWLPPLASVLALAPPDAAGWLIVACGSVAPVAVAQGLLLASRGRARA